MWESIAQMTGVIFLFIALYMIPIVIVTAGLIALIYAIKH